MFLKLKTTTGIIVAVIVSLIIGFYGGMEYKAYQVRKIFNEATKGLSDVFGNISGSSNKPDELTQKDKVVKKPTNSLAKRVELEITKKGFFDGDFQEQITMDLKFTNKTEKDIKGVEGIIAFYDIFDNKIKAINVSYDKGIPKDGNSVFNAGIDYNQFIDENVKLKNTDLKNLKYEWEVKTIIYEDGSKETN